MGRNKPKRRRSMRSRCSAVIADCTGLALAARRKLSRFSNQTRVKERRPPTTNVCPHCGFAAKPVNKVKVTDGELCELDRNKRQIVNTIEVYGQFKWICQERGYKSGGWAYHKAEEYFGCKPVGFNAAAPCPPSQTILSWEKSRRIAYAKGWLRSLTALSSTIPVAGIYYPKGPWDIPF